ncbi:MAG: hypothetical protein M1838_003087 [Thelocarpon superellum]|nr:MAG: hypothetical protein M1838_003087 [Thelocarpon superellum]
MTSPFAPSTSSAGTGTIHVELLPSRAPNLKALSYTYPLKLVSPTPTATAKSILVFLLTYGGGLVAGDEIRLSITVAAAARLSLVTQGSTRIFKAPRRTVTTSQNLSACIGEDGALLYLPDPIQPFSESVYEQRQIFHLASDRSSLCLLDWLSEGRTARGERWGLWRWSGRNEVYALPGNEGPTLLLRDNVLLEGDGTVGEREPLHQRMHDLGVFGTLVLRGPLFEKLGISFLEEFAALPRIGAKDWSHGAAAPHEGMELARVARQQKEVHDGVLWTAAAVRGLVVVKFGARQVEGARHWLGSMLRDEGTVEAEFGEESLLCLS